MNVKELPRRVDKAPVVKAAFLGWLRGVTPEAGYFAAVITHDHGKAETGEAFEIHLLRASGLDRPWLRIESDRGLGIEAANVTFETYEALAEWPKGEQA